ncbi:MOSC domain-containing protein [Lophiotrema nucula]|uniref:MOSC domain-containing protein n=1 Tax=Lophiotrema nucula TaxID=690887 RepID=A0A6A5Z8X2_9PLEO|nr:MOSC domain-containing protein [Lophiotrema nucula]
MMKISKIYVYPIKSLRPTPVSEAVASQYGFDHDRRFMLLKVKDDGSYQNMHVGAGFPQMTLFLTNISPLETDGNSVGLIHVDYKPPKPAESRSMKVPLRPSTENLHAIEVNMHNSPCKAFKMPAEYSRWFSDCFGFDVILAYLGDNLRTVRFEEMKPSQGGWISSISSTILGASSPNTPQIGFADCAPYLLVSKTSLDDVSSRLEGEEEMDVTKFRPNIVIEGAENAWDEDYWGKIKIGDTELNLEHNCVRCKSINVDYNTGEPGTGVSGSVLKKMQKDRRVDMGAKYSPVFGRYGYWSPKHGTKTFRVGDEVSITQVNPERTVWSWKGLG